MKNERQSVIPDSTKGVDAAAYAVGRNHKGNPPEKLGVPKCNLGIGRRGAEQPKIAPKYPTFRG